MRLGLLLAAVVLVLDQVSKWFIIEKVMRPEGVEATPFFTPKTVPVAPFFDLVMTWNRGVSFGVWNTDGPYNAIILTVLSLTVVAFLLVWMWRSQGDRLLVTALGLIVGGALGNVIDRVRFGAVADFLYLHVGDFHWPAFNLADSAITVGAALMVADALFRRENSHKT